MVLFMMKLKDYYDIVRELNGSMNRSIFSRRTMDDTIVSVVVIY